MKVDLNITSNYFIDKSGKEHESKTTKLTLPYEVGETIYICTRGWKKYKVVKSVITGIWLENDGSIFGYGYEVKKIGKISSYSFKDCYLNCDDALNKCLELNNKLKIKIEDKT